MKAYIIAILCGIMVALGFAPTYQIVLSFLGLINIYLIVMQFDKHKALYLGFFFGLGYFATGVSWVYVSIHEYGNLHPIIAGIITIIFLLYLSIFFALAFSFARYMMKYCTSSLAKILLFSSIWVIFEFVRATLFGGFPWLLLGYVQIDTWFKPILRILGVYGASFITVFIASSIAYLLLQDNKLRNKIALILVLIVFSMMPLKIFISHDLNNLNKFSVAVIQKNLSMNNKWDSKLFWNLMNDYLDDFKKLMPHNKLVVLPESAIPIPDAYVEDFLNTLDIFSIQNKSALLFGILVMPQEEIFYNGLRGLGNAKGMYLKQHLVPFGEYIPKFAKFLTDKLNLQMSNLSAGNKSQEGIKIFMHKIASLICYEIAYPQLLRAQLKDTQAIVSISDDGWFGHSFAMYQHLQMARSLSYMSNRYQILANNDGLSSVIDNNGKVVSQLPAFNSGILQSYIKFYSNITPWALWGDYLIIIICLSLIIIFYIYINRKNYTNFNN